MPLIKNAASNLSQGVSQQAESQRFPSQAEEQINAYSSHIKGLVKRQPSEYVSAVGVDATADITKSFIHTIHRDSTEQYAVVINRQQAFDILATEINTSTNVISPLTLEASEVSLANGDRITFSAESGQRPPLGIVTGTPYYVRDLTGSWTADPPTATFKIAETAGGAVVELGKQLLDVTTAKGIKLESYRHTDNTWIDGVFALHLAAGHTFSAGDTVTLNGLTGDTANYIFKSDEEYVLRKPTYNMAEITSDSNGTRVAPSTNKFLLGKINGDETNKNENFGFETDTRWQVDEDDDGWTMLGNGAAPSNLHWVLLNDAGAYSTGSGAAERSITKGKVLKWDWAGAGGNEDTWPIYKNTLDADTSWTAANLEGALIRVGSQLNTDKSIRAVVDSVNIAARTITLSHYIDIGDDGDFRDGGAGRDAGSGFDPYWNFIAFWSDTTMNQYATPDAVAPAVTGNNPRRLRDADTVGGYIGQDGSGNLSATTGSGEPGVNVYDLKTGVKKDVTINCNLSYLVDTPDPHADLAAVSIADYTFLVNKTKRVGVKTEEKHRKQYEAFVSCRTADYGKEYKINLGGKDNIAYDTSVALKKSQFLISGVDADGQVVPVCILRSKLADPEDWDNFQLRLLQNWRYYSKSHGKVSDNKGMRDILPPTDEGWGINEKVACMYDKEKKKIMIWINFPWATSVGKKASHWKAIVQAQITTVKDVIDGLKTHPIGEDWEVVPADPITGLESSTLDGSTLKFDTLYIGKESDVVKTATWRNSNSASSRETTLTWREGQDETIAQTNNDYQPRITSIGWLTPSVAETKIVRRFFSSSGKAIRQSTNLTIGDNTRKVLNGEFFYRTPDWTGDADQSATGTTIVAELLASDGQMVGGTYKHDDIKKADGTLVPSTHLIPDTDDIREKGKEDLLGLTFDRGIEGSGGIQIQKFTAPTERIDDYLVDWNVLQFGNTIAISNHEGAQFGIDVADDLGGDGLKLTYIEVDEASDLPNVCRHGHVVKIIGDSREEADDYYLKFVSDAGDPTELGHGTWVETVGYEMKYKFDASTMPLQLVRQSDGTFSLEEAKWTERDAGDDLTNPFPSFNGNTITDIFLYKNRLGVLSGENVILSESGEYFNFFRRTTAALLDSSPIDVTASTSKVSVLRSAVPFHEKLILFSDHTQFVLDAQPFLSPKTVSISVSTDYGNLPLVKPAVSGKGIYFGFARSGFSGLGQLVISDQDADLIEGVEVTSHVPKYLQGTIRRITAAATEDILACVTDDVTSATIYVYKYFNNAQGQKVQSAWFKYVLGGTNDFIPDISFIGNVLYLIIRRGDDMFLESITFEDDLKGVGLDYNVHLDRRLYHDAAATAAENLPLVITSGNSVTLPYTVTAATTMLLCTNDTPLTSSTVGTTTFTAPSSISLATENWYVGDAFTMDYTFSQPFLKSEKATESGRYQIMRGILSYANARAFTVDVTHNPLRLAPTKHTISSSFAAGQSLAGTADLASGVYKFGIQEKSESLQIGLKNSHLFPADFLGIDYEATAYSRGTRWKG